MIELGESMEKQKILVLDFGGPYTQQVAKCVRENHVYSEVRYYTTAVDQIILQNYKGIILTGSHSANASKANMQELKQLLDLDIPVLGIGFGAQILVELSGGHTKKSETIEYKRTTIEAFNSKMFTPEDTKNPVWLHEGYLFDQIPNGFIHTASIDRNSIVGVENVDQNQFAYLFHPEVDQSSLEKNIFKHFVIDICRCNGDWTMKAFVEESITSIRDKIGNSKVLCALSGGVDSSVSAVMVHQAVGKQLTCIFVDHGLLRKNEGDEVEAVFKKQFDMNLIRVNAQERFLTALRGVVDPEQKRKIIGEEFIRVFEEEAKKIGQVDFLVQGTIYPDIIESGSGEGTVIKSHHNVGGLPDRVDFKEIIEPLRELFKDEGRQAGLELGIPSALVWRQPFPGPGLGIRVIGEITQDKLDILKEADAIFREEVLTSNMSEKVDQYFAIITDMKSVGVSGEKRTYDYTIALRCITTNDFMSAEWTKLPYELLEKVSKRITNEVKHVNRIVYDITSKPPATIEWE